MLPLRDNIRSRNFPAMNVLLIAVNLAVFFFEITLDPSAQADLIRRYALIPAELFGSAAEPVTSAVWDRQLLTATFLHGGWLHILGNMLFLWVFGDNVENLMGPFRYLLFYLMAGAGGNLAHAWFNPESVLPTIGASGAVAGVLGAYLLHFPRARVLTLVFLGVFATLVEVPAVFFLLVWFALQLVNGLAGLAVMTAETGGVAWWAHVGGFVGGALLAVLLRRRLPQRRYGIG